jgi:hypothetical protein
MWYQGWIKKIEERINKVMKRGNQVGRLRMKVKHSQNRQRRVVGCTSRLVMGKRLSDCSGITQQLLRYKRSWIHSIILPFSPLFILFPFVIQVSFFFLLILFLFPSNTRSGENKKKTRTNKKGAPLLKKRKEII